MTVGPASTTPGQAIFGAILGALFVLIIAMVPLQPWQLNAAGLLGAWLCLGSLITYWSMIVERTTPAETPRWIPLRFSGPTGRFRLRPRGDGRRIEVCASSQVVAEVIAADSGDEIVLGPNPIAECELDEFGTALGRAIEMAVAADGDRPADRRLAGPASWGRPEARSRAG